MANILLFSGCFLEDGAGSCASFRSVLPASPCDSLGLMVLSSPDSGIFQMKWDCLPASELSVLLLPLPQLCLSSPVCPSVLWLFSPSAPALSIHVSFYSNCVLLHYKNTFLLVMCPILFYFERYAFMSSAYIGSELLEISRLFVIGDDGGRNTV